MKAKLLRFVETVFADAGNCEPPADYQQEWQFPGKDPYEEWEEMELYLDQHRSVFDVQFPYLCVVGVPEWAEARVAASVCYTFLEHPAIDLDADERAALCYEFAKIYTIYALHHDDIDFPFRCLDDDQWGALLAVCLWSISDVGPVKQWELFHISGMLREMQSAICRMATSRHLPPVSDKAIANYIWDELSKLEQPNYAEAMKPPRC